MHASAEIRGADVIGLPGQNLTARELGVLVGLADGVPGPMLTDQFGTDAASLRQVETSIQAKLGARNRLHMITRAFNLGVLIPNALCLLLCLSSALGMDHSLRTRSPRGGQGIGFSRVIRGTASAGGRGRSDTFA